jgi:hypothetical protein
MPRAARWSIRKGESGRGTAKLRAHASHCSPHRVMDMALLKPYQRCIQIYEVTQSWCEKWRLSCSFDCELGISILFELFIQIIYGEPARNLERGAIYN